MKFTATAVTLGLASMVSAQLSAIPIVEAIAPQSISCAGAKEPDQCREAPAIAKELVTAFFAYGIYNVNQMAAITSLMAFESLDFKFKRNQGVGNFGQGTANMQKAEFNLEYAKSIPDLAPLFQQYTDINAMNNDEKEALLDAVIPDEYNFGSGPWFIKNKCEPTVLTQLESNADAGFESYMKCVGVPFPLEQLRIDYWNRAKAAFGITV